MDYVASETGPRYALAKKVEQILGITEQDALDTIDSTIANSKIDDAATRLTELVGITDETLELIFELCSKSYQPKSQSGKDTPSKVVDHKTHQSKAKETTFTTIQQDVFHSSETRKAKASPNLKEGRSGAYSNIRSRLSSGSQSHKNYDIEEDEERKVENAESTTVLNCLGCGKIYYNIVKPEFTCRICHRLVESLREEDIAKCEDLRRAIDLKNRILALDRDAIARKHINDRACDFSEAAQSRWISSDERKDLLYKAGVKEKYMEENRERKKVVINTDTMRFEEAEMEECPDFDRIETPYNAKVQPKIKPKPLSNPKSHGIAKYIRDIGISTIDSDEILKKHRMAPTNSNSYGTVENNYYFKSSNDDGDDREDNSAAMCYFENSNDSIIIDAYGDEPIF